MDCRPRENNASRGHFFTLLNKWRDVNGVCILSYERECCGSPAIFSYTNENIIFCVFYVKKFGGGLSPDSHLPNRIFSMLSLSEAAERNRICGCRVQKINENQNENEDF